ncbi:MAG: carboxypeptidase regulatory-like domain-containing protein [Flavobacteriales bacterium]|nr:carboxypeptidase regulatory-like domain-containing protein [Flavobacteriales bacterium]
MNFRKLLFTLIITHLSVALFGQTGEIRGFVYDKVNRSPIYPAAVYIHGGLGGAYTDANGFYSITGIRPGKYQVSAISNGYDTMTQTIEVTSGTVVKIDFYIKQVQTVLTIATVNVDRIKDTTKTKIAEITITQKQLTYIPTVGGEPDLVQYLQVLPGVVFSGDQGGQLYIRGGSPVMNKVLLDGMTIYNPFHSIGLFSVFDADIIRTADVYSAGFSSEYGGRISAIVDVKTRDGDRAGLKGKVNLNTFTSKVLLEGPLKNKKSDKISNVSYVLSYKNSYLNKTSNLFYKYVGDGQLPYSFGDLYGKLSFNSNSGSYLKLFYFDFNDLVDFKNTTSYQWKSNGFGGKFLMVPEGTKTVIDGFFAYSDYNIEQKETDSKPRSSGVNGFNMGLNFGYFYPKSKLRYGMEINGFKTSFQIYNAANRRITQDQNTTELATFINFESKPSIRWIIEPGIRAQFYASLGNTSFEPRIRAKYLLTQRLRIKSAVGLYSQNLMSASSDRDVVNLFYGFLSGPDELPEYVGNKDVTHRLQKARHFVTGFEVDVDKISTVNIEGYVKDFTQITNINRDKIYDDNPENASKPVYLRSDYVVETGLAYGYDITYKREKNGLYLWLVYSYNNVSRYDGIRTYSPHFDRRHNANVVTSYATGKNKDIEINLRWNFGSGFPFTLTQGFYENLTFGSGLSQDYRTSNGDFTVVYDDINRGRLPYYHRLDASVKKTHVLKKDGKPSDSKMEFIVSCTNVYNRKNIFYFDRVHYQRINQLPIMPSVSASYVF